jgi:hypothetical protein
MFNLFAEAQLTNPLAVDFADIPGFVKGILSIVMYIGVPFIGLVLVWSGFKFLFARGKQDDIKKATYNITWVVIGVAVFLGAWALTVLIDSTIKSILNG